MTALPTSMTAIAIKAPGGPEATAYLRSLLLPSDTGLDAYPKVQLGTDELGALARGQVVKPRGTTVAGNVSRASRASSGPK